MTADTKICATDGCTRTFARSRTDSTVNCPEHRGRRAAAAKPRKWDPIPCCKCGHVHTTMRCDRCGF